MSVPQPGASSTDHPESVLEVNTVGPHPRPPVSEARGVGPGHWAQEAPPAESGAPAGVSAAGSAPSLADVSPGSPTPSFLAHDDTAKQHVTLSLRILFNTAVQATRGTQDTLNRRQMGPQCDRW